MNNRVSVIIPVYNNDIFIERSIKSVLSQSYENIEIIVINDGSTDGTSSILNKFSGKENVILKTTENLGVSNARNEGLKLATGHYVMFLDSDDYYTKEMVSVMVETIESNNVDGASCQIKENKTKASDKSLEITKYNSASFKEHVYKQMLCGNNLEDVISKTLFTKIYRRKIIEENKVLFSTDLNFYEDYLFVIEYLLCCESYVVLDNAFLYCYEKSNPNSVTKNYHDNIWENYKLSMKHIRDIDNVNQISNIDNQLNLLFTKNAMSAILHQGINCTSKNVNERIDKIDQIIQDINEKSILHKINKKNLSCKRKLILYLIQMRNSRFLLLIAVAYQKYRE